MSKKKKKKSSPPNSVYRYTGNLETKYPPKKNTFGGEKTNKQIDKTQTFGPKSLRSKVCFIFGLFVLFCLFICLFLETLPISVFYMFFSYPWKSHGCSNDDLRYHLCDLLVDYPWKSHGCSNDDLRYHLCDLLVDHPWKSHGCYNDDLRYHLCDLLVDYPWKSHGCSNDDLRYHLCDLLVDYPWKSHSNSEDDFIIYVTFGNITSDQMELPFRSHIVYG